MANDLAAVSSALTLEFQPRITRTVNRKSIALRTLPITIGAGQAVTWGVETSGAEGATAADADGADITSYAADTRLKSTLPWAYYRSAVKQSGLAMAAAASTQNPEDLRALLDRDFDNAANALASRINQDFYTQASSAGGVLPLTSISSAIGTTGLYGTIDRTANPLWQGQVSANGGVARSLTLSLMRSFRRQLFIAGASTDMILCGPDMFDAYGALVDTNRRYVDEIRTARGDIKLDAGFKALEFEGIPLIRDKDCPAGTMIWLQSDTVELQVLPDATVPGFPELARKIAAGSDDQPASLPVAVNALARTGDAAKAFLKVYIQLVVKRPNANGIQRDLQ